MKKIKTIEAFCIIGMVVLFIATIASIITIDQTITINQTDQTVPQQTPEAITTLADRIDALPASIYYGQKLPVTKFRAGDGSVWNLDDCTGKKLILLFWGSWCPHCDKVLQQWEMYDTALSERSDYSLILINKLDPDKGETINKAQTYLSENNIPFECVYDEGLAAYEAYGVKRIPTLLILDEQGYLRYMTADVPPSSEMLQEMFEYIESGGSAATERFLIEHMMGSDGGVFTTFLDKRGSSPTGHDVLSESQGLLMAYAVLAQNRALFEQSWHYAKERLYRDGVFAWYATAEGKQASANALIDDLRIYRALSDANTLWGGWDQELAALADSIWNHNVYGDRIAGFYDFLQKRPGSAIPLFYLELETLRDLQQKNAGDGLHPSAEDMLREGYISDTFPLYYSTYHYTSQKYDTGHLNTSEALMTLYHAAKAGLAKRESLEWLEQKVVSGTLAARYHTDGQAVKGFDYDSTAAYAIAALIGAQSGNARLYTYARHRMEKYYVRGSSALRGSFSDRADGSDIIAFDQLMPLLVYASTKDIQFDD